MSKSIRIFLIAIATVLVGSILLFITVNYSFISPYYIHQKKAALSNVCNELSLNTSPLQSTIDYVEATQGVIVAAVPNSQNINLMNEQIRHTFLDKGLGLTKYWLWEDDYATTLKNGSQQRVYPQGNLGYNILVQYLIKENQLLAVATVTPHLSQPLALTNAISTSIMGTTALLLMALVWWMSARLKKAQDKVLLKNEQMKQLLNHVSHDLKTPVALIKAYTSGMKDGLDDGTFLKTITKQNERMEQLTKRLLDISKYEEGTQPTSLINISSLLLNEIERQTPLFAKHNLFIEQQIQENLHIQSNENALSTIFENLLSNAAAYATDSAVYIKLYQDQTSLVFEVKNATDLPSLTDTSILWEPFHTGESSRNSDLSGSGLGLSLVRSAASSIGAKCLCEIVNGYFSIRINNIKNR